MSQIGLLVENTFTVGYLGGPMATFGANLRRLREAAGIRAKELAKTINVSPSTLSGWENDKKGLPETPTLFKLAKALNTSIDALLEDVDAMYSAQQDARANALISDMRVAREATTQEMARLIAAGDVEAALALGEDMIVKFERAIAMMRARSGSDETRLRPDSVAVARAFEDGSLTLRGLISTAIAFDRQRADTSAGASIERDAAPTGSSSRPQEPTKDQTPRKLRGKNPEADDETP